MAIVDDVSLRERFARALCESDAEDWRIYLDKADLVLEVLLDPTQRMLDAAIETGEECGVRFNKARNPDEAVREMWRSAVEAERRASRHVSTSSFG
jgi:hypothetical protein